MPRSQGVYTLPSGYLAVTGETVIASQHNAPLEDIASALTNSLPRDGTAPMQGNLPMGGNRVTNVADGVNDTDAANVGQVGAVVPIGTVLPFAGSTAPTGWLFCYGQAVSRTTYASLFSAIGTVYGAGDSTTTFNLPDLRGRTVAGKDDMGGTSADRLTGQTGGVNGDTLGAAGGEEAHELTEAEQAEHDHGPGTLSGIATGGSHRHDILNSINQGLNPDVQYFGDQGTTADQAGTRTQYDGGHTHPVSLNAGTTASSGSGEAHNNVQPTLIMNMMIKAA